MLHGSFRAMTSIRDRTVRESAHEQVEYLALAQGQAERVFTGGAARTSGFALLGPCARAKRACDDELFEPSPTCFLPGLKRQPVFAALIHLLGPPASNANSRVMSRHVPVRPMGARAGVDRRASQDRSARTASLKSATR